MANVVFNFNNVIDVDDLTNQVPVNDPWVFRGEMYVNAEASADIGSAATFTAPTDGPREYGTWSGGSKYLAVIFSKVNGQIELLDSTNGALDGSLVGWLPPFVDSEGNEDTKKRPLGAINSGEVVPVKLTGMVRAMFTNADVSKDSQVYTSATDGQVSGVAANNIALVGVTTAVAVDASMTRVGAIYVPNRAYTAIS